MADHANKISQQELRRMMKERSSANTKKITSAHAKYNSLGQLFCTACCSTVKSELQWNAHVLGRTHKENVAKQGVSTVQVPKPVLKKNRNHRLDDDDSSLPKRFKEDDSKTAVAAKQCNKRVRFTDCSSSPDGGEHKVDRVFPHTLKQTNTTDACASLPPGFFDEQNEKKQIETETSVGSCNSQSIPEGFFDDAKLDAKARSVPYKDKMDVEMERFQQELKESEIHFQNLEEDDEEEKFEKEIEEIDESMLYWKRLYAIIQNKPRVTKSTERKMETESEDESGDEDDDTMANHWGNKSMWRRN